MAWIYTDEHGWRRLNPEVQARIDAEAEQAAIERAESVDALKAKHIPGWLPMTPEEKAALTDKNLPPMTPADEDEAMLIQAAEATELVVKARKNLLTVTLNLNAAKAHYEDAKRDAYLMGAVTGKNAEEREARLASVLEVQIHNVRTAETEYLKARTALECAEDVIHHLDRTDRIMARFMPAK